ncbi:MAG: DUF2190 family protein [Puniceicoccales bacterium]|jgi:hypothetical protein|nr:DUF2190 family protein [Puniceicoccales bacterium]
MKKKHLLKIANCAAGTHGGDCTFTASESFSVRHLLACFDGITGKVKPCGVSNVPIGTVTDEAAVGDPVNVRFIGGNGTVLMVAAGAIQPGALLAPAAAGKVQVGSGAFIRLGIAIGSAQAAGDQIEVLPHLPAITVPAA